MQNPEEGDSILLHPHPASVYAPKWKQHVKTKYFQYVLSFEELFTTKCERKMNLAFGIINFISKQMSSKFYTHCQLLEKEKKKTFHCFYS